MASQLSKNNTYNLEYQVPRIELGAVGRQNRSGTDRMRLSAGMTEPMEFLWGNSDGVPLNTVGFTAKLVFWSGSTVREDGFSSTSDPAAVVMSKLLEISDPHAGHGFVVLSGEDTAKLWQASRDSNLRWGVFLINSSGDVFPLQTTPGSRSGTVEFDGGDQMPLGEIVRSA